ncbi:MAG: hypothetical protein R2828_22715 [Saprospiraceae bacterium]
MKYPILRAIFLLGLFLNTIGFLTRAQSIGQTQADSYTQYILLDPTTHQFQIIYDVSATTAGAQFYYNTLRKGSAHEVTAVYDRMTGLPLEWKIVSGNIAQKNGYAQAEAAGEYLQIALARPIPEGGEARVRIDKTYTDSSSYFKTGEQIVFSRTLGIKRNSVVLPAGYELISCNYPSQVMLTAEGQLKLSFMNRGVGAVPYEIKARLLAKPAVELATKDPLPWTTTTTPSSNSPDQSKARLDYQPSERAFQDREIVYFLQQPETHSFRLYHDYTESRVGIDSYLNIVREGSKASNPSAYILDTGQKLIVETLKGDAIAAKGIKLGASVTPETEVVAIWFDAVKEGQSVRLRIEETYTDPNRYLLYNGELVWDRSFGRNQNTVILPQGWYLTTNSIPAVISETETGEISLFYMNDRPDNVDVFIRGRRRE